MDIAFVFPLNQWPVWLVVTLASLAMLSMALRILDAQRRERLTRFVEAHLAPRLLLGYDARLRRPLHYLTLFAFAALALALAQPHWGEAWRSSKAKTRDIMVVLDVSHSMDAGDTRPSRLERSKYKINALMDRLPGDRFGLVAFAGAADLKAPLTADRGYFLSVLNAMDTHTVATKGTNIAAGIDRVIEVFAADEQNPTEATRNTRAIFLLSDGEAITGDAITAARRASAYARIYAMGVGDPRGVEIEIPSLRATRIAPGVPARHWSKLDEESLVRIAEAGNGAYVRLEPDDWDLDRIEQFMADVSVRSVDSQVSRRLVNRYQWPLAAAVALFAAEGLWLAALPHLRRRRALAPRAEALPGAPGERQHA